MSTITLYRDEQCKDAIGSGFVGEYRTIYGHTPDITQTMTTITFPDDEAATEVYYLRFFYYSTINDKSEASEFNLDTTEDSSHYDYAYFSSVFRLKYKIEKQGEHQFFCEFGRFEYNDNGTWKGIGSAGVGTINNAYDPPTISFRTLKKGAKYRIGTYPHYADSEINSENFLGVDVTYIPIGQSAKATTRCLVAVSRTDKLLTEPEPEPYVPKGGRVKRGGTGTGYYPNSRIPALPVAAINAAFSEVLGTGNGLTYYKLTGTAFKDLTSFLYGNTKNIEKYRDCLVSAIFVPVSVSTTANPLNLIYLGNKSIAVSDGSANYVTQPIQEIDFGKINFTDYKVGYKNFADITNTRATLYLPCYGAVNIDMKNLSGGIMTLHAAVDVRNGNIFYRVETQTSEDDVPVLYGQYNGNCGIPVPVGGSTSNPDLIGMTSSIGSVAVGLASGNPVAFASGALSAARTCTPSIDKSGALQPLGAAFSTPVPILEIEMQRMVKPYGFDELAGLPSVGSNEEANSTVKTFVGKGYFECILIHADIPNATDAEKEEIERLFKEGVIL